MVCKLWNHSSKKKKKSVNSDCYRAMITDYLMRAIEACKLWFQHLILTRRHHFPHIVLINGLADRTLRIVCYHTVRLFPMWICKVSILCGQSRFYSGHSPLTARNDRISNQKLNSTNGPSK